MASDRSAHHTIAGYHYQFDKSILVILRSSPDSPVELEAVEDVDVEGECIQVKYHATQKYSRSKIRKPLVAFLEHYCRTGGQTHYRLYAHFGATSNFVEIDLPELKAILGDACGTLGLSDATLKAFLHDSFVYERADDLQAQQETVLHELGRVLNASSRDCEQYYYSNALHEVFRLARQATVPARTTTRAVFVQTIDRKSQILARWLAELRGQRDYTKAVRDSLKAMDALRATRSRFVFLAGSLVENESIRDIAAFCRVLADRFYALGEVLYDAVPLTVIVERSRDDVLLVQRELLDKGIRLNTGYEAIQFQPAMFNAPPIVNRIASRHGKVGDTVTNASHRISVISAETYRTHQAHITLPDSLIVCGHVRPADLPATEHCSTFVIANVSDLTSLSAMLK